MRKLQKILAGCRYVSLQLWAITLVLPMMQPAWGNELQGIKQTVAVTEITGVKVNSTSTGIEVILQTSQAEALQVVNKSDANNFIVEIPNAQLRLPLGDSFEQEKPLVGIIQITVTKLDVKTVWLTVVSEKALPTVELFDDNVCRAGFWYKFTDNGDFSPIEPISLYTSYSSSFVPVIGNAVDNSVFEPQRGTQYEVGVKADLSDRLSATLAAYQIAKTNVLTTDLNNPSFSIQVGEQRSRGVELDIAGEILTGWKIIAAYAYTDACGSC
ncbi:MAG: TonB-dependent receptor [Nostoc sp.]